jgi:hypothetical protein
MGEVTNLDPLRVCPDGLEWKVGEWKVRGYSWKEVQHVVTDEVGKGDSLINANPLLTAIVSASVAISVVTASAFCLTLKQVQPDLDLGIG